MPGKKAAEPDSVYVLKILLFFLLGSMWVAFDQETGLVKAVPFGFIIGLLFAHHDHFQVDRKIEYAILLASAVLSYVAPIGLVFIL